MLVRMPQNRHKELQALVAAASCDKLSLEEAARVRGSFHLLYNVCLGPATSLMGTSGRHMSQGTSSEANVASSYIGEDMLALGDAMQQAGQAQVRALPPSHDTCCVQ